MANKHLHWDSHGPTLDGTAIRISKVHKQKKVIGKTPCYISLGLWKRSSSIFWKQGGIVSGLHAIWEAERKGDRERAQAHMLVGGGPTCSPPTLTKWAPFTSATKCAIHVMWIHLSLSLSLCIHWLCSFPPLFFSLFNERPGFFITTV